MSEIGSGREGRRAFLERASRGLGLLASAELAWAAARFLAASPAAPSPATGVVEAGPVEAFPPGSVTPFPSGSFYLVRLEDGGFLALASRCTHLGCAVAWDAARGRFACPCHGSTFDLRGDVAAAPAPRPLDLLEVSVNGGRVRVDARRALRRQAFDAGQVVQP